MKSKPYMALRSNEDDAMQYAVVDGPSDNFAVVDIKTAIEIGGGYKWAF